MKTSGTESTLSLQTSNSKNCQTEEKVGGKCTVSSEAWYERALQHFKLEDPSLLRGVAVSKILRQLGQVLSRQPAARDYHTWSMEVPKISIFISHSWTTPRWSKLLVLLLHFNLWKAMLISTLVSAICCCLVVQGTLPHSMTESLSSDGLQPHSMVCTPAGIVTFWASLLALHELDRCCIPIVRHWAPTAFLDKVCIHQTDLEVKKKAIQSLAAFIANSDDILVCYSDLYLRRLWTIYELATWLIVQPGKRMILRPCFLPQMLLYGQLVICVYIGAVFAMTATRLGGSSFMLWFWVASFLCRVPLVAACSWLVGCWAEDRDKMKEVVENFSLAKAQCAVEDDRPVIKANIVAFMKYAKLSQADAQDEEVVEAFEDLVHRKVPELLRDSFGRVGIPYAWTLVPVFPQLLYTIDQVANSILQGHSPKLSCLSVIAAAMVVFTFAPIAFAVNLKAMRWPCMRSFCGHLSIGLAFSFISSVYAMLSAQLPKYASDSLLGLVILLAMWGVMIAAVVAIYRQ